MSRRDRIGAIVLVVLVVAAALTVVLIRHARSNDACEAARTDLRSAQELEAQASQLGSRTAEAQAAIAISAAQARVEDKCQ